LRLSSRNSNAPQAKTEAANAKEGIYHECGEKKQKKDVGVRLECLRKKRKKAAWGIEGKKNTGSSSDY